ncbi:MAG: 30S ribosomal protein S6 [Actinobacteria bacterium]|jgi:small subunit ribosomal protein S6|nr:30S ribosomal protein S6 [Actinomycetota bacterium]
MNRPYEVVLIIDSGIDEEAIQATIDKSVDLVKNQGGLVGRVDKWGRKRFAYELKNRWEGYYALVEIDAEPVVVAELDRVLSITDEILRYKILRTPEASSKKSAVSNGTASESVA